MAPMGTHLCDNNSQRFTSGDRKNCWDVHVGYVEQVLLVLVFGTPFPIFTGAKNGYSGYKFLQDSQLDSFTIPQRE